MTPTPPSVEHAPAAGRWRPSVVLLRNQEGEEGQGVLVTGRLVLTAAHCITCESVAGAALGDRLMVPVRTPAGGQFRMAVMFLDPFADIAVLGPADDQDQADDADAFERYADETEGMPLHPAELPEGDPVPGVVYSHTGELTPVTVTHTNPTARTVWVESEQAIPGGTSGGPVVSEDGRLLAVVSQAGGVSQPDRELDELDATMGVHPFPARALPVWAFEQIVTG